ncbi:MAG: hypothetical protein EOM08_05645 [Clostridia bacterium]|nr:hypothetical protein [Clostridia bacterium]
MNLFVHLKIAARIADQLELIHHYKINRWGFFLGNLLPDLQHNRIPVDHFFATSWPAIRSLAEHIHLESKPVITSGLIPFRSVNIGMLCHFISDYFCYAHTASFGPGLFRHMMYEARMMSATAQIDRSIMSENLACCSSGHEWEQSLVRTLAEHHSQDPDMQRDFLHAIIQGTQLTARLSLQTHRRPAYDRGPAYDQELSTDLV